ncbi:MAG: hypothetical protein ABI234_00030 [Ktedonobacteraceae bacterium]
MPSSERLPPKQGSGRKAGVNPLSITTTQNQRIRAPQYSEDDLLMMEDDPDASNPPRPPSSAIRINPPTTRRSSRDVSTEVRRPTSYVPPRRTQKQDLSPFPASASTRPSRNTTAAYPDAPSKRGRRNIHWLFYVGLSLLAALSLWALGAATLTWGTNEYNSFLYGYPRTYQTDVVVGHSDSTHNPSHFIAVNLHGQIIIIEIPGGDPSKSINYVVGQQLIGPQADLVPVTLAFRDLYHTGKINMIVSVADQTTIIFCNNGVKFTACNSSNQSSQATP